MSAMALALITSGVWVSTPTAQAVSYRYWSYWTGGDSGWTYASFGPASLRPADGSVEGWRFGIGSGTNGSGLMPRSTPDFQRVCAGTEAQPDAKRVAIIIDPGLAEDAPHGESPRGAWAMCVTAPPSATGFDILRAAATVRTRQGMVCGLAGYPASECAVIVQNPQAPSPTQPPVSASPRPTSPTAPKPVPQPVPTSAAAPAPPPRPTSGQASAPAQAGAHPRPSPPGAGDVTPDMNDEPGDAASPVAQPTPTPQRSAPTDAMTSPEQVPQSLAGQPEPQITIVSAAVSDTSAGPGPFAAVAGAIIIAALGAGAFARRRLRS
jgi:hypothetical protein